MKRKVIILLVWAGVTAAPVAQAQNKIDEERMERDIEVAENILGTLIKQEMGKRNFFPYEVEGNYTPGYGVTFRLPMDLGGPMMYMLSQEPNVKMNFDQHSYTYTIDGGTLSGIPPQDNECENCPKDKMKNKVKNIGDRSKRDSLAGDFNQKIIDAARNFIVDYGDLIGQLPPEEKIMVTNRHEGQRFWFATTDSPQRKFIALEGTRGDITQYKLGKLTRDQLLAKIAMINSESLDELSPDLELLSSIFNRLYRPDLSKSYYIQENIYYERLKNYGVIYYMQVYSSNETDFKKFNMPTVNLEDIDKETRDKQVTRLYPEFENDIKESMLDYGRTLKSLKDDEALVFNIKLTRCEGCGIPKSVELSVKNVVLREYSAGKLSKADAMARINVKKGPAQ